MMEIIVVICIIIFSIICYMIVDSMTRYED